jgi:hypothetical protein
VEKSAGIRPTCSSTRQLKHNGAQYGKQNALRLRVALAHFGNILGMPCFVRGGLYGYGVLRLRRVMRFALDPAALRMTDRMGTNRGCGKD